MAVTLGPVLIALCSLSVWIKLQVRGSSPLYCTDLIIVCIFQLTGGLSRVPLLLPLPTAPPRCRPPCSVLGTPCPCSSLGWWSPPSSIGWRSRSSPTLTAVLESPGPSNAVRFGIAVLFSYIFLRIQMILPYQKVFPLCTFSSVPSHNFPRVSQCPPLHPASGLQRVSLNN